MFVTLQVCLCHSFSICYTCRGFLCSVKEVWTTCPERCLFVCAFKCSKSFQAYMPSGHNAHARPMPISLDKSQSAQNLVHVSNFLSHLFNSQSCLWSVWSVKCEEFLLGRLLKHERKYMVNKVWALQMPKTCSECQCVADTVNAPASEGQTLFEIKNEWSGIEAKTCRVIHTQSVCAQGRGIQELNPLDEWLAGMRIPPE